jgi:hypothetical protein
MLDARAFLQLFSSYRLSEKHRDFLLLEAIDLPPVELRLVEERQVGLGEIVELPSGASAVWTEIDVHETILNRLLATGFKPARVVLHVTMSSGNERDFRLSIPAARGGFLISPVIMTSKHLEHAFREGIESGTVRRVGSLSLRAATPKPDLCFRGATVRVFSVHQWRGPASEGDRDRPSRSSGPEQRRKGPRTEPPLYSPG